MTVYKLKGKNSFYSDENVFEDLKPGVVYGTREEYLR